MPTWLRPAGPVVSQPDMMKSSAPASGTGGKPDLKPANDASTALTKEGTTGSVTGTLASQKTASVVLASSPSQSSVTQQSAVSSQAPSYARHSTRSNRASQDGGARPSAHLPAEYVNQQPLPPMNPGSINLRHHQGTSSNMQQIMKAQQ